MKSTIKQYIIIGINLTFCVTVLLFLLDGLSNFEIKYQALKTFVYYGMMVLPPFIFVINFWLIKNRKWKFISLVLPIITVVFVLISGPLHIMFSSSVWETQTVLYQNNQSTSKKVEFQMQDMGALGYNRRTVEVNYFTSLFMIVNPADNNLENNSAWTKVE